MSDTTQFDSRMKPPPITASRSKRLRAFLERFRAVPPPFSKSEKAALRELRAASPRNRWEAAGALAQTAPSARVVNALVNALKDPNPFVRFEASRSLVALDAQTARPTLIEALQSESVVQAAAAAETLGQMREESATEPLLDALERSEVTVRMSVLEALAAIGGPLVVPTLISALDDPDSPIRWTAATLLGQLRADAAALPLAEHLADVVCIEDESSAQSAPPDLLRRQLAWALIRVGGGGESTLFAFLNALSDVDAGVRWLAATGLGLAGDERALQPLRARLADKGDGGQGSHVADAAQKAVDLIQGRLKVASPSGSGNTDAER